MQSNSDFRAAPLEAFCRVHPVKIKEKTDSIVTPTENNYILVRYVLRKDRTSIYAEILESLKS